MDGFEQLSLRGWKLLRLSTPEISLDLVPGLGGTITSLRRRSDGTELLWPTPWGLRPPGSPSLAGSSEAQALDTSPGGWQTLFPNGGDTAVVHGVEWGFDGEARLTPMDWRSDGSSVTLTGRLARSPFELTKAVSVSGADVTVTETIHNVGGEALEVMWGQQVALAAPLVGADSVVDAAATGVHPDPTVTLDTDYEDTMPWPRSFGVDTILNLRTLPPPRSGETRMAYLTDFTSARLSVTSATGDLGVDLEWDLEEWPSVWYSMEAGGRTGYPWYSSGYVLTLTPCSSWPGHGVHDARRIDQTSLWVQPGEVRTSRLTVRVRPEAADR